MMEMLDRLYFMLCSNIQCFFEEEKGAVDIVAIVVLIGIAVLLAILFREQIEQLLESLFRAIQGNATKAVN